MKKKFLRCLSLLVMVVLLVGCALESGDNEKTEPQKAHVMKVGYARVDITPKEPLPLAGLMTTRYPETTRDPLYATCIAYTDESGNTVLMFHLDILKAYGAVLYTRRAISQATGVPAAQIVIATNHNHSGPNLDKSDMGIVVDYCELLEERMTKIAQEAMEDRKPAQMSITKAYPENLNFIRHYLLSDGSYGGDNFGSFSGKTIVKHAVEVDNELQLVKFTREGGKDVLVMNWQGHPTGHGEYREAVLSHVDVIRRNVEKDLDCHFAYVLGASGNVNSRSRIAEENVYGREYEPLGKAMADRVVEAAATLAPANTGLITLASQSFECTNKKNENVKTGIPIGAFSIGDVAFVTAPYEMFSESGKDIKTRSPFPVTMVSTCTNGSFSYIPTLATFEYGGYEVDSTRFVAGTAEKLADAFVEMLGQIKNNG